MNDYPLVMTESIGNSTPMSKTTNIKLSGNAPSVYRKAIARDSHAADELVDQVISGHLIEPDLLWGDDFYAFFRARREALCALVESALGKPVTRDVDEEEMADAAS